MNSLDLIIVALFLITVVYIVNQAIASVDKQTKVELIKKLDAKVAANSGFLNPESPDFKPKEEPLERQLDRLKLGERSLKEIVDISFKFEERYKYSYDDYDKDAQPRALIINVENKSNDIDVYIDWDRCSLTDYENASRRVVRLSSDRPPILSDFQPPVSQPPSLVAPGGKLTATLTAEDTLKLDAEKQIMEPKTPILDLKKIKDTSKNKKVPKAVREKLKKMLTAFDYRERTLDFFMRLALRLVDLNHAEPREYPYYLWCKFTVTNMPWFDQLPWNPKLKK